MFAHTYIAERGPPFVYLSAGCDGDVFRSLQDHVSLSLRVSKSQ